MLSPWSKRRYRRASACCSAWRAAPPVRVVERRGRRVQQRTRRQHRQETCDSPGDRVSTSTPVSVTATMCSPLRRQLAVLGHHGPAIRQHLVVAGALVDHRLDGEGHARLQHQALARTAVMHHLRLVVVDLADAVAAVLAHHAEPLAFGIALDGMADVAQGGAGRTARMPRHMAKVWSPPGGGPSPTADAGMRLVAVPAVADDGDVDVDDVAISTFPSLGMPWQMTLLTEVHTVLGKPR